jgi:hypothetical protein
MEGEATELVTPRREAVGRTVRTRKGASAKSRGTKEPKAVTPPHWITTARIRFDTANRVMQELDAGEWVHLVDGKLERNT